MVGAFEQAWSLLKALPEQQMFEQRSRPAPYGSIPDIQQQRLGTVHPAIVGMLNRLENPHEYKFMDDEHDRRLMRTDLFSNVPMRPNLRVMGAGEQSVMPLPGTLGVDLPYPASMIPINPSTPQMIVGRTPLSIENYGKYFSEDRAAFVPYDAKLHTGHFNIPLASGDRVENSSPLRPRDASYGLGGMQ